jgi:methylphosphotriester-DNA--protein-cysteine methyltransferase
MIRRLHPRDSRRANLLRDFIASHVSEIVTLQSVSRELGLSHSTIRRALRDAWGIRFHALVERSRVERVLSVLAEEPELKDSALANAAGWRSRTSLYAAVRRVTGSSLRDLRHNAMRNSDFAGALSASTRPPSQVHVKSSEKIGMLYRPMFIAQTPRRG